MTDLTYDEMFDIYCNHKDGFGAVLDAESKSGHSHWGHCRECECAVPVAPDRDGKMCCGACGSVAKSMQGTVE